MTLEPSNAEVRLNLEAQNLDELKVVHDEYRETLPPEAAEDWDYGALYVRFSSDDDFRSASPSVQLHRGLSHLTDLHVYVPWEGVVFEQGSATTISGRAIFRSLLEDAIKGRWKVVGAHMSDRLFRNEREHTDTERRFEKHGVRLEWVGKLQGDEDMDPDLYAANQSQRTQNAMLARVTSKKIGVALEYYSSKGRPVGRLPEGFQIAERGPDYRGRVGRPIRYERSEPLATIIATGAKMYLAGATYLGLEAWSETTVLAGVTAKGTLLSAEWWRNTLQNPKYAAHQKVTVYAGFSKGNEEKYKRKRHESRRTHESPLIACILPEIITLEEHRAIVETSRGRRELPKNRKTYSEYLVSGIVYDNRCGHRLNVLSPRDADGKFRMVCRPPSNKGSGHNSSLMVQLVEAQLDAIIGAVRLDHPELLGMIEEELQELYAAQRGNEVRFRPNPEIAATRAGIAALPKTAPASAIVPLEAYLAELLARDEGRRRKDVRPVQLFRKAVEELQEWSQIWGKAPISVKNGLLREAGVQVSIASLEASPKGPAQIVSIKAKHPTFALALAVAVRDVGLALPGSEGYKPGNAMELVVLSSDFVPIARLVPRGFEVDLSAIFGTGPQDTNENVSMREAAKVLGVCVETARRWMRAGFLATTGSPARPQVARSEIVRLGRLRPNALRVASSTPAGNSPGAALMSISEAAVMLGISRASAYAWASAGKLPTEPGPTLALVRATDVDLILRSRARGVAA